MTKLANELSWSRSRDGTFQECKRQYYYRYYGSWGGWEPAADPETREIYILKQLKSRQMWAGITVHSAIERSLENLRAGIEPLGVEEILRLTRDQMRTEWKQSRDRLYRTRSKTNALFEHEYEISIAREEWQANADHVETCLKNFYESETYQWIQGLPRDQWLEIEDFSSFYLDEVKVHVKLDFACRVGDQIRIFDWKTGKKDEADNSIQLACYAFYAREKWQVAAEQIRTIEYNLARNQPKEYRVSDADLDRIQNYIAGSIRDMKELIVDSEENLVEKEIFPLTTEEWRCRYCNFKRLCGR